MDTNPIEPLSGLKSEDLEVVALNGTPRVECGRDLAIVRHVPTRRYFALADGARLTYSESEITTFRDQGRLTLLPVACSLPPVPGNHQPTHQVRVLWVKLAFILEFSLPDPSHYRGTPLYWQTLPGRDYKATCAEGRSVEGILNLWGQQLLDRADSCRRYATSKRLEESNWREVWKKVKRLADLGLCAAVEPGLRYSLYKRYAAAQSLLNGERDARRTFDCLFRQEFPKISWEEFEGAIEALTCEEEPDLPVTSSLTGIAREHRELQEAA